MVMTRKFSAVATSALLLTCAAAPSLATHGVAVAPVVEDGSGGGGFVEEQGQFRRSLKRKKYTNNRQSRNENDTVGTRELCQHAATAFAAAVNDGTAGTTKSNSILDAVSRRNDKVDAIRKKKAPREEGNENKRYVGMKAGKSAHVTDSPTSHPTDRPSGKGGKAT